MPKKMSGILIMLIILLTFVNMAGMQGSHGGKVDVTEFSPAIIKEISKLSNGQVQYLTETGFGDMNKDKYKIIKFEVSSEKRGDVLKELKNKYGKNEYQFFYTQLSINKSPELICVLKSSDKYDILRALGTNGKNYGVDTEEIIHKLVEWDKQCGIHVIGADGDWVEVKFNRLPKDTRKFAEEIYEFCPDVVDQHSGNAETLEESLKADKSVFLWWD